MAKKQIGNSNVRYHKLTKTDEGFVDLQFQKPQPRIPYKGIIFAASLFLCGTILIIIACLLFVGHINGNHSEGAWPLLMIGALVFIPGIYHVRIAYFAYRGYPGYAFDDIPDFD